MSFSQTIEYYASLFTSAGTITPELDFLTTIIKLHTLKFRPLGTKLSFSNDSISFDLPTSPICIQGAKRRYSKKRSSRNDVTILKRCIENFIKHCNLNHKQLNSFAQGCIAGLRQLYKVYETNCRDSEKRVSMEIDIDSKSTLDITPEPVLHCIEFYISILEKALDSAPDKSESKYNSLWIDGEFKSEVWNEDHVNLIYTMINELEKMNGASSPMVESLLNSIDSILESKKITKLST